MKYTRQQTRRNALMALLMISVTMAFANIQPDQKSSTSSDSFSGGAGAACTTTTTPGSWYCGSCWFYSCGCACTNATVNQVVHSGTAISVTVSGVTWLECPGPYGGGNTTNLVTQQVCYNPN